MTAIRLDKILGSGAAGELGDIVQNAQILQQLTIGLKKELPPELAAELLAANVRAPDELVVIASTSAWAAKLRFEEAGLLKAATELGAVVARLTVRVSRQPTT